MIALVALILLHNPNGTSVEINVEQITSMRGRHEVGEVHFTEKAKCLINLTDGKYITVIETCDEVRRKLKGEQP